VERRARRALLAGGGSGGHLFPALAVGEELERRGWRVSYAGTARGLEATIAASRGLDFHALEASAITGRGTLDRVVALAVLLRSTARARRLVRRLGAEVAVATGGYASVPAALGAWTLRRPVVLVEPNATPGLANRELSRIATVAAVAWPQAASSLRCPARETGVPVRRAFSAEPAALPATPPWRLLVLGGSQGAAALNEAVPATLVRWIAARRGREPAIAVVHQAGHGKEDAPRRAYQASGIAAEVTPFLDDVPGAMAASHLVLSRAGAVTLAEICAAGRPALLFPLALAAGHQLENARALERAGAAEVVEGTVEATALLERLERLLDPRRLAAMAAAARALARPQAASSIADLIEETVDRR
jgi:UDP-N-acetylglucosamine--N-acetylmuramyl-(pentapeptide) pyrophosphoryl-undecaprenol N-acetylglucosamine transferase